MEKRVEAVASRDNDISMCVCPCCEDHHSRGELLGQRGLRRSNAWLSEGKQDIIHSSLVRRAGEERGERSGESNILVGCMLI